MIVRELWRFMMLVKRPRGESWRVVTREGAMAGGPQLGWGASFDGAQDKLRLERSAF